MTHASDTGKPSGLNGADAAMIIKPHLVDHGASHEEGRATATGFQELSRSLMI